jgi:hypothetical protein
VTIDEFMRQSSKLRLEVLMELCRGARDGRGRRIHVSKNQTLELTFLSPRLAEYGLEKRG